MARDKDFDGSEPLEAIEVPAEFRSPTKTSRRRRLRSRSIVVVAVLAGVVTLEVAATLGSHGATRVTRPPPDTSTTSRSPGATISLSTEVPHPTQATAPIKRPSGRIPGRFYPALDHNDTTAFVLLSGLRVRLSRGLTSTIGGLGAVFGGSVSPKDVAVCCSVNFEVDHAAPSDLFATLGSHAVMRPVLVSSTLARQVDLKHGAGPYAILSTGDWTLVATSPGDPAALARLNGWRLRSTPHGAALEVPVDSTIDYSGVVLGRTPDLSDRQVELTENSCAANAGPRRTITPIESPVAVGYWCVRSVRVRIEGPRPWVESVVAELQVDVGPNA